MTVTNTSWSKVESQVIRCLQNLVSWSGHNETYLLTPGTFEVTKTKPLNDGLTKYWFAANGAYDSDAPDFDRSLASDEDPLMGTIVLDRDLNLVISKKGIVRFSPWRCKKPTEWLIPAGTLTPDTPPKKPKAKPKTEVTIERSTPSSESPPERKKSSPKPRVLEEGWIRPSIMLAVVLYETGEQSNLRVQEFPVPNLQQGEVLVRIRATGVCYRDIVDRRGGYPNLTLPMIPGHEFAGDIVEIGPNVDGVSLGDRVVNLQRTTCGCCSWCEQEQPMHCDGEPLSYGLNMNGGYAEYVAAPASTLVHIPDGLSYDQAAPLACTAGVALRAIRGKGKVEPGETVLVTGASGGVGHQMVQLLKSMGATVIAVTSTENKIPFIKGAGADAVLLTEDGSFHKELREKYPDGIDASFEIVGSVTFNSSLRCLRPEGRMVIVGNIEGNRVALNPGQLILYGRSMTGSAGCTRGDLEEVLDLASWGDLTPPVTTRMPLREVIRAQEMLENKEVTGRIVLIQEGFFRT